MPEPLTTRLWDHLGSVSSQLRRRFAEGGSDLGFVALATLRHLARHGGQSVTALAIGEGVTTQAISLRVSPLLERGLVRRDPDPDDRRRAVLTITPAGRRVVERAQSSALSALDAAVADLTARDRTALVRALPALEALGARLGSASQEGAS